MSAMSHSIFEVHQAIDNDVADQQRQSHVCQRRLDQRMIAHIAEIVRRKEANNAEQKEWHGGQEPCRYATFGSQRTNLEAKLGAVTHQLRQTRQNFRQIAAGLALYADCRNEEHEILLT